MTAPKTRADLHRERARLYRRLAEIDMALAGLEAATGPKVTRVGGELSMADIVDLAIENANTRPTKRKRGSSDDK